MDPSVRRADRFVEQRREVPVQNPSLLHKFELPGDIGIQAHEEQSPLLLVVPVSVVDRAAELAAAPEDSMVIRRVEQRLRRGRIFRETVARIGPAHVRAKRAAMTITIVPHEAEIVLR